MELNQYLGRPSEVRLGAKYCVRLFTEQQSLVLCLHTVTRSCEQYSQNRASHFLPRGVLAEGQRPALSLGVGNLDKVIAIFYGSSLVAG